MNAVENFLFFLFSFLLGYLYRMLNRTPVRDFKDIKQIIKDVKK